MADLFEGLKQKLAGRDMRIVFPEGLDERILGLPAGWRRKSG